MFMVYFFHQQNVKLEEARKIHPIRPIATPIATPIASLWRDKEHFQFDQLHSYNSVG